jgi:hypothetical protein
MVVGDGGWARISVFISNFSAFGTLVALYNIERRD